MYVYMCGMGGMGLYVNIFTQYVAYMYVKKNIYSIYIMSHPIPFLVTLHEVQDHHVF